MSEMKFQKVMMYAEDGCFRPSSVAVSDGIIVHIEPVTVTREEEERIPYLLPGLIDIHFHGAVGADVSDGSTDAIQTLAEYEASVGVTSICPATMSVSEAQLHQIMLAAGRYREKPETGGAHFAGLNMEGPFINPAKKGAQAEENIRNADHALFHSLQEESGHQIRLLDLAPEMPGAIDFIRAVHESSNVVLSIAHTEADYETAASAFAAGAAHVTHLFNAMPPFAHRAPGVVGAALDAPNCRVELICDGIHIHPSVIRAAFAMFGEDRMIMISDSMRAAGLSDGTYTLGGQKVTVSGKTAKLDDGTIAGSVTCLTDCLRYAVKEAGIPLKTALRACTVNPAKEIGIYDRCGSITVGKQADLILMNRQLDLLHVYVSGRMY